MSSNIAEAAHAYRQAGLCVLPAIRAEKRPAVGQWRQYRDRLPTESEVSAWFANEHDALGVLCGRVSGNNEMIDFDAGGELFDAWAKRIPPKLLAKVFIETTQNHGRHVDYRHEGEVCGNMKLAQRKVGDKIVTLIETRGEGGLFLCTPTPGYERIQGDLANLPVLTAAERETLLQAAWDLNEYVPPPVNGPPDGGHGVRTATPQPTGLPDTGDRPGDDYNRRGDVRALLEQHGWSCVRGGENEYWRRPGKTSGMSATWNGQYFYVFSSNAAPFEPNQAYLPFAVYTLLNHGGDYELAAGMLRAEGFGSDGLAVVASGADISAIVGRSDESDQWDSDDDERPASIVDPGPMPVEGLRMPGFVSEVMDHCLATAPYPNPVIAFCGALSLLAFLTGRKVRDAGDNRTNIYLLGLAHSAAGKDWPRKLNTRIIHEVGLAGGLGERFASGEGIQDALFQTPAMLFQTDEIDGMLQSVNKAKDARHEAIMSTLLTMYSSANSVYPMRRKAGKEAPGVIDQPSLVIFGTAIPNHYYEALSERMLTNGFFARMIILEAGPRGTGQEPGLQDLPPRVLDTARWWANYRPGTGNLEDWHPVPTVIEHADDARGLLIDIRQEAEAEYARAEEASDAMGTTVWGRVSEQVRKLALLHAVSENHRAPRISLEAVQWASRFVMHQTRRMLFMAATHVAENDFDALIKRAVAVLRQWRDKHGSVPMPHWRLRRKLKQRPGEFKDIVVELTERRIAAHVIEPGKTKPKSGYCLL